MTAQIAITQNTTYLFFSVTSIQCLWHFDNICTLHYNLLLVCKFVVSRLQHNIDSLQADNVVNDIDLLYAAECCALSHEFTSGVCLFPLYNQRLQSNEGIGSWPAVTVLLAEPQPDPSSEFAIDRHSCDSVCFISHCTKSFSRKYGLFRQMS